MSFKKTLMVGVGSAVVTAGVVGLGVASASNDSGERIKVVDKGVMKIGDHKGELGSVSGEGMVALHAEMEEKFKERLDKAVADGKLTAEQKDKILTKRAEMNSHMESDRQKLMDISKEDMHAMLQERHEAVKKWAQDNNIPMEYLIGSGMHVGGHQAPQSGTRPTFEIHYENANE